MGSTILVILQKSFKVVSSLINDGKLQMCAGTQGILRKKFSCGSPLDKYNRCCYCILLYVTVKSIGFSLE